MMNKIFARANLRLYFLFLVWGLVFLIGLIFPTTPLTLLIGFLFLLFWPGFSLARILKINIEGDRFGQWMVYLSAGIIFNFLLCLIAILVGTNITVLLISYGVSLSLLFIGAFILDLKRPAAEIAPCSCKDIFKLENLIYLIPVVLVTLIISALNIVGADFTGDPTWHISIIRKVVDGGPLGIGVLAFLKNQPDIQYAYLIWPTFLGLLSKIFHLNIFTLWNEIIVGLTVIVSLAWFWVFKQIFGSKYLAILGLMIFLIFNLTTNGWLFARLPVPDTIAKIFLLPMALALAFQYIFAAKRHWKVMFLSALIILAAGLIHLTQYVYFFLMLGAFGLVYLAGFWRAQNYQETLKRLLILFGVAVIVYLPFFLVIQFQTDILGKNLRWFADAELILIYGYFKDYEPPVKLAFLALPLTLLFWRKNPKIIFLSVIMMLAPIIYYFDPLREWMSLKLSFVLVRRMFTNVVWYFGIWALIGGFIVILIDRAASLIKSRQIIIDSIIGLIIALVVVFDLKFHWLKSAYQVVFGPNFNRFLEKNFVWLIVLIIILALALFIGQKYSAKIQGFFEIQETKNHVLVFVLTLVLVFWLATGTQPFLIKNLMTQVKSQHFLRVAPDATAKTAQTEDIGGDDVLEFIKSQLPKRPIFETNSGYRDLSQLADVYMSAWPGVWEPDRELSNIYRAGTPMNEKFACLAYYKVEYLLLTSDPVKVDQLGFSRSPQYLTPVYSAITYPNPQTPETVQIYQVNTSKIQTDFQFEKNAAPPLCRAKKYQE